MAASIIPAHENSVEITATYGEWFVRVMRDGQEHVRSFEREALAAAFAEASAYGCDWKR